MRHPAGMERFSTQAVLIVAAWTLVAAVFAAHNILTYAADGRAVPEMKSRRHNELRVNKWVEGQFTPCGQPVATLSERR
jgi:hypothetical protein